jgi:hypothetical protein
MIYQATSDLYLIATVSADESASLPVSWRFSHFSAITVGRASLAIASGGGV